MNDKINDYDNYNKLNDENLAEINNKLNNLKQEILNMGTKLDLLSGF